MNTPIYYKDKNFKWPEDKFFYLVAKEGIYQCRNHMFFRSCVKAENISGLEEHREHLTSSYPIVPKAILQRVAGFFGYIAGKHDAEAIVLLAYNMQTFAIEEVCPEQWVEEWPSSYTPGKYYSDADIKYKVPTLPSHLIQIGDIHSHINFSAYHSHMDIGDEKSRPGLHLVIGKLNQEPPDMCAQVVADGGRFDIDMKDVIEGYDERQNFPAEWLDKFSLKRLKESPHKTYKWDGKNADKDWWKDKMADRGYCD